ncbi:MAG: PEGA domain-containing protein, partial [Atribacterota bacterium]
MKYQKLIFIFLFFLLSKLSLFVLSQGTGYFQIQSDPQASIILDDKVIGKIPDTGSLLLKNVPTGTHELQIVKEGYKVHTEIIEIRSNEIQFHSVVLTPKIGALLIEAEPVECTIEIPQLGIDEKNKGKKTGKIWELSSIPIGNYLINLTASNKRVSYSFEIEEEISKCLLVNILDNEVKEIKRVATYNWEKTYGGSKDDEASSIIQTADGNYVVAGYTESKGAGRKDAWILKLDSVGNIIWDKTYGGRENDSINSIIQLNDGNYVVAGYTESKGAGRKDAW